MKHISFYKFVNMLEPQNKIPEYMKSFIKDMENNKRYCICVHKRYSKNTLNDIYKKYLERVIEK